MTGLEEFLSMGGYAEFVWTSYGLAAIVLITNIVAPILEGRRIQARLERQQKFESRQT
jgi:heme exporter protein D